MTTTLLALLLTLQAPQASPADLNAAIAAGRMDINVSVQVVPQTTYWYEPQPDITTYELARLLPMFSGPSYGMGEWSTGGRVMPSRDVQSPKSNGCRSGAALCRLADYEIEELGTAARHFRKCRAF
jgi:hypothetical protein